MMQILSGVPIWVWPLLVLLLFVGLRAARERTTSIIPFYFLPLLGLVTLKNIVSSPLLFVALGTFALAYLLGSISGFRLQSRWIIQRSQKTITLRKELLTLLSVMVLFFANFVSGMVKAIAYDVYAGAGFVIVFSLVVGLVSGSFLGRSLKIFQTPVSNI